MIRLFVPHGFSHRLTSPLIYLYRHERATLPAAILDAFRAMAIAGCLRAFALHFDISRVLMPRDRFLSPDFALLRFIARALFRRRAMMATASAIFRSFRAKEDGPFRAFASQAMDYFSSR